MGSGVDGAWKSKYVSENIGIYKVKHPLTEEQSKLIKVKSGFVAHRQKDIQRHTDKQMDQKLCNQIFNLRKAQA